MSRGAVVGLAAIVVMVTEPWWRRVLDYRPPARPERPSLPAQDQPPMRGTLLRPGRELERGDRW
jgi:hypothetical protein